jgi:hypothetical protein
VYEKGIIINKKREIAYNYVNGSFIYDALALVPLILELTDLHFHFKYWNLLMYMKLVAYYQILYNFGNIMNRNKTFTRFLEIFRLILFITFAAHVFGCAWWGLATLVKARVKFHFFIILGPRINYLDRRSRNC